MIFKTKKAQSVVEYTLIAGLVLVGIFVMSPQVIKSVSDIGQQIEYDAKDSVMEDIEQAPVPGLNLPACTCDGLKFCACGDGNSTQCPFRKEHWCQSCKPPGCELDIIRRGQYIILNECRENTNYPTTKCCDGGILPWNPTNPPLTPKYFEDCGGKKCCGPLAAGTSYGNNCPDGYALKYSLCGPGTGTKEYVCWPDAACNFYCKGGVSPNATLCPGDGAQLTRITDTIHVANGTCTAPKKCEAQCKPGFIPNKTGDDCVCPFGAFVARKRYPGTGNRWTTFKVKLSDFTLQNILTTPNQPIPQPYALLKQKHIKIEWNWYINAFKSNQYNVRYIPIFSGSSHNPFYTLWIVKGRTGNVRIGKNINIYKQANCPQDHCSFSGTLINPFCKNPPTPLANILVNKTPIDNHARNMTAYSVYDTNNKLDYIQFISCNPDTSGNVGWKYQTYGVEVIVTYGCKQ